MPVRFASTPWNMGSILPAPIVLSRAVYNAVVVLHDDSHHEFEAKWGSYLFATRAAMDARGQADVYIPFGAPGGEPIPASDAHAIRVPLHRKKWKALPRMRPPATSGCCSICCIRSEGILGVRGATTARSRYSLVMPRRMATRRRVRSWTMWIDWSGRAAGYFLDTKELNPGEDYKRRFEGGNRARHV